MRLATIKVAVFSKNSDVRFFNEDNIKALYGVSHKRRFRIDYDSYRQSGEEINLIDNDFTNEPHPFTTNLPATAVTQKKAVPCRVNLILALILEDNSELLKFTFELKKDKQVAFDNAKNCIDLRGTYFEDTGLVFNQIVAAQSAETIDLLLQYQRPDAKEIANLITVSSENHFHPWRLSFIKAIFRNQNSINDKSFLNDLAKNMLQNMDQVFAWGDQAFHHRVVDFLASRIFETQDATPKDYQILYNVIAKLYGFATDVIKNLEAQQILIALLSSSELSQKDKIAQGNVLERFYTLETNARINMIPELQKLAGNKCIIADYLLSVVEPQNSHIYFKKILEILGGYKLPNTHKIYRAVLKVFEPFCENNQRLLVVHLRARVQFGHSSDSRAQIVEDANQLTSRTRKADVLLRVACHYLEDASHAYYRNPNTQNYIDYAASLLKEAYSLGDDFAGHFLAALYTGYKSKVFPAISHYGRPKPTDTNTLQPIQIANYLFYREYNEEFSTMLFAEALQIFGCLKLDSSSFYDLIVQYCVKFQNTENFKLGMKFLNESSRENSVEALCLKAILQDKYNPRSPNTYMREAKKQLPGNVKAWPLHYARAIRFKETSYGGNPFTRCLYLAVTVILMPRENQDMFSQFVKQDALNNLKAYFASADPALKELAEYLFNVAEGNAAAFLENSKKKMTDLLNTIIDAEIKEYLLPANIKDSLNPTETAIKREEAKIMDSRRAAIVEQNPVQEQASRPPVPSAPPDDRDENVTLMAGLFKPVVAVSPPQAGLNNNNNAVPEEAPSPYPPKLQQFIDGIKAEKKPYRKTLAELGVELSDEFCCPLTLSVPNIPVRLDGLLYDLDKLLEIPADQEGKRKHPFSRVEKFDLTEIQPDRNLRDFFVAQIKKAEQEKATQEQQASPRGPNQ